MNIKSTDSTVPNCIELTTTLQATPEYPNSAFFVFDFDFMAVFGSKGRIPVILNVDGHRFRSSIAVYSGVHMMVFNAEMRQKTGYKAGDTIRIRLERDLAKRDIELPDDLRQALADASATDIFAALSYTHKKEYVTWLNDAKKAETRASRITKLIAKLTTKA